MAETEGAAGIGVAVGVRCRAVRGVIAGGAVVVDCVIDEAVTGQPVRLELLANGMTIASALVEHEAAGPASIQLMAPLTAVPELVESIAVRAEVAGLPVEVLRESNYLLDRTLVRVVEDFEANVMRKHMRVRDRETLCFAARQALRRFPGDLRITAVSLAVIGYRIAENPDGVNEDLLAELAGAADRLLAGIDRTIASEARWSSSLNVMMFNVYATLRRPEPAMKYLLQLFADRHLVRVEPMCAFNCMIGIVALGYLYRLQKRNEEAVTIWGETGDVFGISALNMPKTFGAICEFEFIQTCAKLCITGIAEIGGARDRRMLRYADMDVAALCLRAPTNKGVRRTAAFFAESTADPELLPSAAAALAYRY